MGHTDATKRVRTAIASILEDNDIAYWDDTKKSRPAITFSIFGHEKTITYSGGDPRAERNAKTQIKRILYGLGVVLKSKRSNELDDELDELENPELEGVPSVDIEQQSPAIEANEPEVMTIETEQPMIEQPEPQQPEPQPDPSIATSPRTNEGYVVFRTHKYDLQRVRPAEGEFIAIKLDHDIVAEKGSMLVIPIHLHNVVWEMPEHEFQSLFKPTPPAPVVQPPDPAPIARPSAITKIQPVVEEPEIEIDEDDFDNDPPTQYTPPPRTVGKPAMRRHGISPQMGRVLVAMYHLVGNGQQEILANAISDIISVVDGKQVSGMLGSAIKLGYVLRGRVSDSGRGSYYRMTPLGLRVVATLGTWPWDVREMGYPPWLAGRRAAQYG